MKQEDFKDLLSQGKISGQQVCAILAMQQKEGVDLIRQADAQGHLVFADPQNKLTVRSFPPFSPTNEHPTKGNHRTEFVMKREDGSVDELRVYDDRNNRRHTKLYRDRDGSQPKHSSTLNGQDIHGKPAPRKNSVPASTEHRELVKITQGCAVTLVQKPFKRLNISA